MDNKTLRAFVIEHKESGMSYQDIADKLKEEFNINRSRQSLQGIYTRTVNGNNNKNIVIDSHILNLYALGYNYTEIQKLLRQLNYSVAYKYIANTIKNSMDELNTIIKAYTNRLLDNRKILLSVDDIDGIIDYKGIKANEKGLNNIIKNAYIESIKLASIEILKEMYQITDNRKLLRDTLKEIDLDITVADIEKKMI